MWGLRAAKDFQGMEQGWHDDRTENMQFGEAPDLLLVPGDMAERVKVCRGLANPGGDLCIGTAVIRHNTPQIFKSEDDLI